jgi:hypothetical protein
MFPFSYRQLLSRPSASSRPASRRARLRCEQLEQRLQPAAFVFSTGLPDGHVATISEPANAHNSHVEYESADDFALTTETKIQQASFTGLLTGGATPANVSDVVVEIYGVFPNDSDVGRTSGPPLFSTNNVPTRVNSPADVALDTRAAAAGELHFTTRVLSTSFDAQNSVSSAGKISVNSEGNGPVTGREVEFDVTFNRAFDLPAGHYFLVPQVGLSQHAPAGADFLWLSAPKPIAPPGTAFPAGVTDLQSWMRDDPPLAPDWLRVGTDIIGGTTFNGSFSLSGQTVPATGFTFSTGLPDGKVATISEPANAHNSHVEYESADDFALTTETKIQHASFTGLLTGGATPANVSDVVVEIYRVFPNDSDVGRTSGPPTFSTNNVPTRVNSPSDVALDTRAAAAGELHFTTHVLGTTFTALNSVSSAAKINVNSQGNGPVTGTEVEFDVTFSSAFDLPAGHYFFVPQVGLSQRAPAGADFLWLSAPRPIAPPGTAFPAGVTDLQSWMRDDPPLAPDWLRIGSDIIGGTTFNGTFSLSGQTVAPRITSLSQTTVTEGSPDLTLTVIGSNFTTGSTVLVNGLLPLTTTFVNTNQLQAVLPAGLLTEEGHFQLSVLDAQSGTSNSQKFTVVESVPVVTASVSQGLTFQQITLSGAVTDQATEAHRVRINWGDGTSTVLDLGISSSAAFTASHTYAHHAHLHHQTILVTAFDDVGTASLPLMFDVIV